MHVAIVKTETCAHRQNKMLAIGIPEGCQHMLKASNDDCGKCCQATATLIATTSPNGGNNGKQGSLANFQGMQNSVMI